MTARSAFMARRGATYRWVAAVLLLVGFVPTVRGMDAGCDVSLTGAQVDYGRLSRATMEVSASGQLVLPARMASLRIVCPEPGDMAVRFQGVAVDATTYRFGDRGRFTLRLRDASLDGASVEVGQQGREGGELIRLADSLPWEPDQVLVPVKDGSALPGRVFTAQIDIDTQMDERALDVRDTTRVTATGSVEALVSGASGTLSLQADVLAGNCKVDVARHITFAPLRSTDLDAHGASTRVPSSREGRLQVLCDAPMPFAFRIMRDERSGTVSIPVDTGVSLLPGELFGLGTTRTGRPIGAYVLRWAAIATSDQGELHATRSVDGGRSWMPAGDVVVASHDGSERHGYARVPGSTTGPIPLTALSVDLDATIYIAPRSSLVLDEEIEADGLVTFEIIY
ncbi:hypothetical protein ACVWWJ_004383 [Luteibacter sp. HA06]